MTGKLDLPERYAVMCGTFRKGVPEGTKGAPSIDLLWVPLLDVLHKDSKCGTFYNASCIVYLHAKLPLFSWLIHTSHSGRSLQTCA